MKKILVITHDTFLSGAPILLLHLMKLLKEKGYRFNTIIRIKSSPLANEFRALSDKCGFYQRSKPKTFSNKLKRKLFCKKNEFDITPFLYEVDCIFSNTITNGEILALARKHFKGPVFSYIHELKMASSFFSTDSLIFDTMKMSDHFFVPSDAVKNYLLHSYEVPQETISLLNYYIPGFSFAEEKEIDAYKNRHNITSPFVIGCIGSIEWRKGSDIFLLVASLIFKKIPEADLKFVWMGGYANNIETKKMLYDINKLQLKEKVVLLDQSPDTRLFFKSIDVLLLPSREDPYPVVVLEAASEKIPTVCFDKAGGAPEFIQDDAGASVPYLNIEAMADTLINYYKNRNILGLHGRKAFEKVKCLHQDERLVMNQFNSVIQKLL